MVEKINDGIVLNVLSLEDSVRDFELICELLTSDGYILNITRVEKESDFTSLLRSNKYDIILADFKLPGFDAFGALRLYNNICPEVPFICVSGSIGEETAIELIKQGAVDYVLKDKLGRLSVVINRALDEAKEKETRKLAEEALREREQSYRTLADSGHALIWTSGTDKLCNYFNRVWLEFTGRTLEQEIGNGWTEGVHPEDMQRCLDIYIKAFDKREKFSMEYRLRRNDGIYRWILDDGCPRFDSKGEFIGYIGHCLDITERKRAEEALSKEQHLLNSLIETTPDSIYFKDNNSCFIRINTTMAKRFGLNDPHNALGKTDFDFFDNEHALQAFEDERQIIATGEPLIDKEEKEVWPGGLTTWVSTTKLPLRDKTGKIIGIMGISRDITARKLAEEKMQETQVFLQAIMESPKDMIILSIDKNYQYLNFNSVHKQVMSMAYGKDVEAGMNLLDCITNSDDRRKTKINYDRALNGESHTTIEEYGDLERYYYETRYNPIINEKNEIIGTTAFSANITERRMADKALQALNLRQDAILAAVPDIIMEVDSNKVYLWANKAGLEFFGDDVIGKEAQFYFDGKQNIYEKVQPLFIGDENIIYVESWQRRKDGQNRLLAWWCRVLKDDKGNVIGALSSARDITESKQVEEALIKAKEKAEESDRLKTAFLHNISHEIRTPMNAIVGFSGLLDDPVLSPEKRKHFTGLIVQSSNQLLSIIIDIVAIATIEAGQERVQETSINLNAVCKLLYEQYLSKAQSQNITLLYETTLSEDEAYISTDKTKLIQILSNIIGNSLKFTLQGYVNFGYQLKNNCIEFFVEDTGIGIKKEMHEEIFKRFSQADGSYTRDFGGSGLGLSISKAYVEILGGKIWLNSELDKGSTFYFTIPYKKSTPGGLSFKEQANEVIVDDDKTITLLIAEDEDFNFMLLEELLAGINSKIIRARNGMEAVAICKSNQQIDLILMDIKMPLMNGYEATKLIREFLPDLPIIAQTAYTSDFDRNKAREYGCNDFISKPLEKKLLVSKINNQLHKT